MFDTAIIIFRETLEMAIVIGMVMAATGKLPGVKRWVVIGILAGLAGAGVMAFFTDVISDALEGVGQEVLNAAVLGSAAVLIGWTTVWMKVHGREMAAKVKAAGKAIAEGDAPVHMVAVVVGLAVLREGAESVLFLYGIALSKPDQVMSMVMGGLLGVGLGAGAGALLYLGLLRISPKHMFSTTSILLALLAAGMASHSAKFLIAADLLPPLVPVLWDSSSLLPADSAIGSLLGILVGYEDRPSALQLLFYGVTLATIALASRMAGRPVPPRAATA